MHLLITGATGYIGSAVTARLAAAGHQLTALGCFLATPRGVVRLDGDEAEAA